MADFEITWPESPERLSQEDYRKAWSQEPVEIDTKEWLKYKIDRLELKAHYAEKECNYEKYDSILMELKSLGADPGINSHFQYENAGRNGRLWHQKPWSR